jgi:predicted DNA-binding transcriptional regulator AlpA
MGRQAEVAGKRLHETAVEVPVEEADRILRVREVAQRLRLSEAAMYRARAEGRGPRSFRVNGRVMYRESEVRRWLAEQERLETERLGRIGVAG